MNLRQNNNVNENVKGMHDRAGHCIPYNKVLKHVVLLPCNGACSINQIKKKRPKPWTARPPGSATWSFVSTDFSKVAVNTFPE